MNNFDVIVIGGGPAGMMAAGRAAERGFKVVLLEKGPSLGRKLLITGGGRCNITNLGDIDKFLDHFSKSGVFLRSAFSIFFNQDLINFFKRYKIFMKTEENERVFPATDKAEDIIMVLEDYLHQKKVTTITNETVLAVVVKDFKFKVVCYDEEFIGKNVIIATGGVSYPITGSTGDGYKFARGLGHKIVDIKPALVAIETDTPLCKIWQGISLSDVRCSVLKDNKIVAERVGDLIFTWFGVSGPVVLDLSATVYDQLKEKGVVEISINFKPKLNREKLEKELMREFQDSPNKLLKNILPNYLPHRISESILAAERIDPEMKANQVSKEVRKKLVDVVLDFRLKVIRTRPISEAIITRGGVSTKDIDPKTMESKKIKGLYFAGEVIDVDAKTGGYNLQAAFSTGWVAGGSVNGSR